MGTENVNHPLHYNRHPQGIECIDIIRHYTGDIANAIKYLWRAGLKPEMGKKDAEKEVEDLKKSAWYIQDYNRNCVRFHNLMNEDEMQEVIYEVTGYACSQIYAGYPKAVGAAIGSLLGVGIIFQGEVRHTEDWRGRLAFAYNAIQQRIDALEWQMKETMNPET